MTRMFKIAGAAALVLGLCSSAGAQTTHRHHGRPAAEGRQITVHARESYLTLGPSAPVNGFSAYARDTVSSLNRPVVEFTFVGMRGLERMPNNFTVPGCCVP